MKWVTWDNVGVDRMGCAWLIRKHVDPKAEFLFIPTGQTILPKGAEPFDIPDGPTLAAITDPEGNPVMLVQQ